MANQPLVITNQFGEESINQLTGAATSWTPLHPEGDICLGTGASAPTSGASGTGDNIAGTGSIYIAQDTGLYYQQTGLITSPTWVAAGSAGAGALLTGLSVSAALLASSDTILQGFNKLGALQNGTFVPTSENVSAAGAISTTKMVSVLVNGGSGTFAATLAAPSSQDGQLKILKMTTATHTVTVACTNIAFSGAYTPAGTTTLTFTATGDSAVFVAVGSKWVYLGGSAIAS